MKLHHLLVAASVAAFVAACGQSETTADNTTDGQDTYAATTPSEALPPASPSTTDPNAPTPVAPEEPPADQPTTPP